MITSKIKIEDTRLKQKCKIIVNTDDYKITGINTNYMHTSGTRSFIAITPVIALSYKPDPKEVNFRTKMIELNVTLTNDITIILNAYDNVKNVVSSYNYEVKEDNGLETLMVYLNVKNEEIQTTTPIFQNDDVLRYYRKLFPVYKLNTYSVQKDEIYSLGKIRKITYDNVHEKFRVQIEDGTNLIFDNYPFSVNEVMSIQNKEHITPSTLYWLVEESHNDLIFTNTAKIYNRKMLKGAQKWTDPNDLIFELNQSRTSVRYNDKFVFVKAKFKIQALNQIITIDFVNKHFRVEDIIQAINSNMLKMFPFPFRQKYAKLSNYGEIIVSIHILDTELYEASTGNKVDNMIEVKENVILELKGEIVDENVLVHSRMHKHEEYYRLSDAEKEELDNG